MFVRHEIKYEKEEMESKIWGPSSKNIEANP